MSLHAYSEYSILQSTIRLENLVRKAKEYNWPAAAVTDRDTMHGAVAFYRLCRQYQVKGLPGIELWVQGDMNEDEEFPVVALPQNNQGYAQLMRWAGDKQQDKQVTWEQLAGSAGCLFILPLENSEPGTFKNSQDALHAFFEKWSRRFKPDALWLEAPKAGEEIEWRRAAEQFGLSMAASPLINMQTTEEERAYKLLHAVKKGSVWKDTVIEQRPFSLEMWQQAASDLYEAEHIENWKRAADKCDVDISLGETHLPVFPTPHEQSAGLYLKKLAEKGMQKRYNAVSEQMRERLEHELNVITEAGFADYFLIVQDFVAFAKKQGMYVGPGRGSAAGSLVSYLIGITDVDPLQYGLLFERFLNPERTALPDIDIDFPDHRREEVLHYLRNKYGENHVAQIVTFNTFGARAAIRDAGRVLEIPQGLINRTAGMFSGSDSIAGKTAGDKQLQQWQQNEPKVDSLLRAASFLEGLPRQTSIHAAGIVLSSERLESYTPLMERNGSLLLTQYPMEDLEALGLVKIDLLGLRNLTLLEYMTEAVQKVEKDFQLRYIPMDDEKTYQLLSEGKTNGIFQLESAGMKSALQQIWPDRFEDIAAVSALYRPGPMAQIPLYAERKHGIKEMPELPEHIEDIAGSTYGIIVYQEQIMQIAVKVAGYSMGEADSFRRAISKKDTGEMKKEEKRFLEKAAASGVPKTEAETIFSWIGQFANYGFNKSHAVAYSVISYQLAYIKAHYPAVFFSSLMTTHVRSEEKFLEYQREAKELGIRLLPPSINQSGYGFRIEEGNLRFGLNIIKQAGKNNIQMILKERHSGGRFEYWLDFLHRVDTRAIGRQGFVYLIQAGVFDEFGVERSTLLASLDRSLRMIEGEQEFQEFGTELAPRMRWIEAEPLTREEKLEMEKEASGYYLSGHPLDAYNELFASFRLWDLGRSLPTDNQLRWAGGFVRTVKTVRTKNGQSMCFLTMDDGSGELEVVVFPNVYRSVKSLLTEKSILLVQGRTDKQARSSKMIAEACLSLQELEKQSESTLFVKLPEEGGEQALSRIKRVLRQSPGAVPVIVYDEQQKRTIQLEPSLKTNAGNACIRELEKVVSKESIILKPKKDAAD
ncbi:DNA polymerase III subunit alpha [uncultured Marinococcus sp.]|uniref:DNA polymerase III subunit alpha n=1 Tax=uncultured Marinococcus sp. TaxID=487012 RepID=UPI0026176637|nr:DNA polymerase III subunit alpha [uncultured Marinococcus sp.]